MLIRIHHSKLVKEWVEKNKNKIEIFYLPSYSPEKNPDEYLNCDLKYGLSEKPAPKTKNNSGTIFKITWLCYKEIRIELESILTIMTYNMLLEKNTVKKRQVNSQELDNKKLWSFIKPFLRSVEKDNSVLIVDDTILEKPYTDESEINTYHYDHSKGRSIKGINVVNLIHWCYAFKN